MKNNWQAGEYYTNGPAEYSGWFVAMCSIICLGVGLFAGWLITYLGQQ